MGRITAIRNFATLAIGEKVIIKRERSDWGMCLHDTHPRLQLPQDTQKNEIEDKLFRKNFIERCPLARGFSNATISILHELGHWMTRFDIDWDKYWAEQENVHGEDYFNIEGERVATDWAITWLSDSANRKTAKAFERAYFMY